MVSPVNCREARSTASAGGRCLQEDWNTLFKSYRKKYPDLADRIERMQRRELPDDWDTSLPVFAADAKGLATRDSSGKVLNAIASHYPWLIGGSADLAPSRRRGLKPSAGFLTMDR